MILFVLISNRNFAQETRNQKSFLSDTSKISRYISIAQKYSRSKPDSSFYFGHQALKISNSISFVKGQADSYNALAYTHLVNYNKNDSANYYYALAYNLYNQINDYEGMGRVKFGLGYVFSFKGDLEKSKKNIEDGLNLFKKAQNSRGILNCYNALSYIYEQTKDYSNAYGYINKAIQLANELSDTLALADYYNSLGNIYIDQALITQAIDVYFKALKLWEAKKDSAGMAIAYGSIGNMYYFQSDFKKALEYFLKKVPLSVRANNHWEVSKTYNSIAQIYNSMNEHDTALVYFQKALNINKQMNYAPGLANSFYNLSNTYFLSEELDSASIFIEKAITLSQKHQMKTDLANNYILKGKIHYKKNELKLAETNIYKGYLIGKEIQSPFILSDGADYLNRIYYSQNDFKSAYKYLKEYNFLQDSIKKNENIKEITRLEMEYVFDKKEQQMIFEQEQEIIHRENKIKRQRIFLLGLIILTGFVILLALLIIRNNRIKLKLKTIDLEQKLLRVQMNPHFIFNSLCAIQNSILENKTEEAETLLSKFARLMRTILESSRGEYIKLDKEIETLKNYLDIQKLRFNTDFDYRVDVEKNIDTEHVAIPPMLAQPFIENAIEHGLIPMDKKGKITLRYKIEGKLLRIEIEDNGIGRGQTTKDNTNDKKSLATQLTYERINNLKRTINKKASFEIIDLKSNETPIGTMVVFRIPYEKML